MNKNLKIALQLAERRLIRIYKRQPFNLPEKEEAL